MGNKYRGQPQPLTPEETCRRLADGQFGVLSRAQGLQAGMTERAIDYRIAKREWLIVLPRIYCLTQAGAVFQREVMSACLWAGERVAASHRTAGVLFDLDGVKAKRVEISVPSGRRSPSPKIVVHRTRHMPSCDLARKGPISVTDVNRTLLDLAGVLEPPELAVALDCALRRRLTTVARLEWRLGWPSERVRIGAGLLRDLVQERRYQRPVESPLESAYAALLRALAKRKLPQPVTQHVIAEAGRFVARVDFAYPDAKVAIEIDGFAAHMSKQAFVNDRRRDRELQAMGWIVLRFTFDDLARLDRIADQVRKVLIPRLA